jgi:hypothetical protein
VLEDLARRRGEVCRDEVKTGGVLERGEQRGDHVVVLVAAEIRVGMQQHTAHATEPTPGAPAANLP